MTTAGFARQHDLNLANLSISRRRAGTTDLTYLARAFAAVSFAVDPGSQELEPGLRRPGEENGPSCAPSSPMRSVLAAVDVMRQVRSWSAPRVASRETALALLSSRASAGVLDLDRRPSGAGRRSGTRRDGAATSLAPAGEGEGRDVPRRDCVAVACTPHRRSGPRRRGQRRAGSAASSALAVDDRPDPGLDAVTPREQEDHPTGCVRPANGPRCGEKLNITRRTVHDPPGPTSSGSSDSRAARALLASPSNGDHLTERPGQPPPEVASPSRGSSLEWERRTGAFRGPAVRPLA